MEHSRQNIDVPLKYSNNHIISLGTNDSCEPKERDF